MLPLLGSGKIDYPMVQVLATDADRAPGLSAPL